MESWREFILHPIHSILKFGKVGGAVLLIATVVTSWSNFHNVLTAQESLANAQRAIAESTTNAEATRKLQTLQIQLQLRERYLQLKPSLDETKYELYPTTKDTISGKDRAILRRYWTDIVFSEWLAVKKFGDGTLAPLWDTLYSKWVTNALREHGAFREEWVYLQLDPNERIYFGKYTDEFIKEINELYQKETGKPLVLADEQQSRISGLPSDERALQNTQTKDKGLKERLDQLTRAAQPDEQVYLELLKDALKALDSDNYGIAACIVRKKTGEILYRAGNQLFKPSFRSRSHAEMLVIDQLEATAGQGANEDLVLYTTLEPCPMCLTRIISSKIKEVYYLSQDREGGMVAKRDQMPPIWQELSKNKSFERAKCRKEISDLAQDIFMRSRDELDHSLEKK